MCVNVTDDTKILDYTMVLHDLHGGKSRSCIYISAYIIKDKPNFISLGFYDIILAIKMLASLSHPAMQYKLFKYLRDLDQANDLNQQIFVTTHSSNISAVAGVDNIFMLSYNHERDPEDCCQQSLFEQFKDQDDTTCKAEAKVHLTKFLDVTRSDMLFADKVILVEGIAEKLLMPLFMEVCGCPYEDEHISIVEIGGKHFNYFVELFNNNAVKKKILCITDNDFMWINKQGHLSKMSKYWGKPVPHIEKLWQRLLIIFVYVRKIWAAVPLRMNSYWKI